MSCRLDTWQGIKWIYFLSCGVLSCVSDAPQPPPGIAESIYVKTMLETL